VTLRSLSVSNSVEITGHIYFSDMQLLCAVFLGIRLRKVKSN